MRQLPQIRLTHCGHMDRVRGWLSVEAEEQCGKDGEEPASDSAAGAASGAQGAAAPPTGRETILPPGHHPASYTWCLIEGTQREEHVT